MIIKITLPTCDRDKTSKLLENFVKNTSVGILYQHPNDVTNDPQYTDDTLLFIKMSHEHGSDLVESEKQCLINIVKKSFYCYLHQGVLSSLTTEERDQYSKDIDISIVEAVSDFDQDHRAYYIFMGCPYGMNIINI